MKYYKLFGTYEPIDDIEVIESIRVAKDKDNCISTLELIIDGERITSFLDSKKYKAVKTKLDNSSLDRNSDYYYIPKGAHVKLRKNREYIVITWKEVELSIFDGGLEEFFDSYIKVKT